MAGFLSGLSSLISSGIGAAGSLLGIGNALSNQAQQQSNFEEQMRFAKYQYEDMKKYNSMVNQVARMRAAGVNPALAIGSGQLGTAASGTSQPSAPSFESLGLGELMNGASNLSLSSSQKEVNQQEAQRIGIDNETRSLKNLRELANLSKELENRGLSNDLLKEELKRSVIRTGQYVKELSSNRLLAQSQADYYDSQALINNEVLNWIPQEKKAAILTAESEIYKNYATGKASLIEAKAALRNSLKQNGIFFNNKEQEDKYVQSVMDAMDANAYIDVEDSESFGVEGGSSVYGKFGSRGSTKQNKKVHVRTGKTYTFRKQK